MAATWADGVGGVNTAAQVKWRSLAVDQTDPQLSPSPATRSQQKIKNCTAQSGAKLRTAELMSHQPPVIPHSIAPAGKVRMCLCPFVTRAVFHGYRR